MDAEQMHHFSGRREENGNVHERADTPSHGKLSRKKQRLPLIVYINLSVIAHWDFKIFLIFFGILSPDLDAVVFLNSVRSLLRLRGGGLNRLTRRIGIDAV